MTLRELDTRSGVLVILTSGGSLMKVKNNRELDQFYLRALSQMKYSHFSWTKFWQIFIVISIQTVSYLALWSDNHQWNNNKNKQPTQYLNKLKNWKENLKGGKEGRRGGPDLHLLHILKKIFSVGTVLLVLVGLCQGPGLYRCLMGWFPPGLCWYLDWLLGVLLVLL